MTAREVDVLRLVAQGLTDAQIAERLIISPRTVNTHPTSIPCRYYTLVTRWITSAHLQHSLGPYHALVRGSPAVENRQHLSRASLLLASGLGDYCSSLQTLVEPDVPCPAREGSGGT